MSTIFPKSDNVDDIYHSVEQDEIYAYYWSRRPSCSCLKVGPTCSTEYVHFSPQSHLQLSVYIAYAYPTIVMRAETNENNSKHCLEKKRVQWSQG